MMLRFAGSGIGKGGGAHVGEELLELVVVHDGQHDVARHDALLLVVARGVAGELEDLGREVLEHGRQVDGRAGADALRRLRGAGQGGGWG